MSQPRVFTVGRSDPNSEPLSFILQGTDMAGGPIQPQTFTCVAEVQGAALTDIIAASKEGNAVAAAQIVTFIHQCLTDEDVERFDKMTHDKNVVIQLELLGAIMQWLVEEYSSRPTAAPSGSPSGQSQTPPTSMGATTSPASPTLDDFLSHDSSMSYTPPSSMTGAH